jgi:hypothetical protein
MKKEMIIVYARFIAQDYKQIGIVEKGKFRDFIYEIGQKTNYHQYTFKKYHY